MSECIAGLGGNVARRGVAWETVFDGITLELYRARQTVVLFISLNVYIVYIQRVYLKITKRSIKKYIERVLRFYPCCDDIPV